MTPKGIAIHWPAFKKSYIDSHPGQKMVEAIRAMHLAKGWSDIGYHYVVNKDSSGVFRVYDGRSDARAGAHTLGFNDWIGISVAYPMDGPLPAEQVKVLADLVASLCKYYKIPLDRDHVKGHREFYGHKSNECPGEPLYKQLDKVVLLAKQVGKPPTVPPQKPAPKDDKPDEMISFIDMEISGKEFTGALYDDKAYIRVTDLSEFGIEAVYVPASNGKEHKVILRLKK